MTNTPPKRPTRREALIRGGLTIGGLAAWAVAPAAEGAQPAAKWDHEADVVCVGSGAAGCAAAVTAAAAGAKVIVIEKLPTTGGTTNKSAGIAWIPNNRFMSAQGLRDDKVDCLRYLARYSYPGEYDPNSPTLGLSTPAYRLLEAFYAHGAATVEHLEEMGAAHFQEYKMWHVNRLAPDYADHLPENCAPRGRALEPVDRSGTYVGGAGLAAQMAEWLRQRGVPILLEHAVTALVQEGGRVVGVEARTGERLVRIRARRAVIFGSGGYAHNPELVARHQPGLYGSCAMPGSTGDFIPIAGAMGASMGTLGTAWRTQVVLEEALQSRAIGLGAFVLPGDSMIVVNKYGRRVVNEKINYNDRTETHFVYDPVAKEYPNRFQFMVFDERTLDGFGGAFPLPTTRASDPFLIGGATLAELATNIQARMQKIGAHIGAYRLAPEFAATLEQAVARFNGYAAAGKDAEFERGLHDYDRDWHAVFSPMRQGTAQPPNPMPNVTMHPLSDQGPFYALILGPGALDTCGGPAINEQAQVLDCADRPILGLYGAGNCVASPSGRAYYGAGHTIGVALTFGHIAARHALAHGDTA
ncbi:flavoprotein, possibly 3-ketosteroid dehydrogenase (plasmid) [Aromatoleum aromaticum EbN1]|uniref:Flavoprotein, possibly 3-ketosteroid dehydrogenase n=1 Tax=Aromatoleum aromaticum (strain DSM 19018 / LMG 30748 / EbN1) TaxID=76114 RepID=Q5NWN6_AROAE|nr:flavoprotein, possibly 3-ketosteroid dehydrogenase [Aromatoleum aromaticum EbN1]